MADIPNRDALERILARKLGGLNRRQLAHLLELLGDPPNIANVPFSFWGEAGKELAQILVPFSERVYLEAADRMLAEIPIGVDWSLVNEAASTWANTYGFDLVRGINDTSRRATSSAVSAYFDQGLTMGQLRQRLGRIYSPVRAEMIATTEVTRAASEGEQGVVNEIAREGIRMVPIWQTNNDALVCPICGPKHGKEITDGQYPPAHPRCLPGNTLVLPVGGVSAGSERWYEGDIIIIETLENKLTVTPNHPILTDTGWIAAGDLIQGDNVICYKSSEWEAALIQGDKKNGITTIKNKFSALDVDGFGVPTSAPDFHGDGAGSDVAIIRPNSKIVGDVKAHPSEPFAEQDFVGRYIVSQTSLSPISPFAEFIKTDFPTTGGFMGSGNLIPPLSSSHPLPLESFGLGLSAGGYTSFQQPPAKSPAVDASLFRESILTLTGKITLQKIVKIGNDYFSGHVYNLQTDSGLYVADGIITHNCRCWVNHELPEVEVDKPSELYNIISKDEDKIRNKKYETGIFYDANGEVILNKTTGHEFYIDFTWDDLANVKDTIFTHNHPSASSFSPDDIKFMIRNQLKEIRAVTKQGTYSMVNNYSTSLRQLNRAIKEGLKDEFTQFGSVDFDNLWKWVSRRLDMKYSFKER